MNNIITIGFTGTRTGMSQSQRKVFRLLLQGRMKQDTIRWFVHGGAVGADTEADQIASELGLSIIIRPGSEERQLHWTNMSDNLLHVTYPAKPPLERNRLIVEQVNEMFAAPGQMHEVQRSGTWATIRYSRKCDVPLTIIYPDGSLGQ